VKEFKAVIEEPKETDLLDCSERHCEWLAHSLLGSIVEAEQLKGGNDIAFISREYKGSVLCEWSWMIPKEFHSQVIFTKEFHSQVIFIRQCCSFELFKQCVKRDLVSEFFVNISIGGVKYQKWISVPARFTLGMALEIASEVTGLPDLSNK